MNKYPNSGIAHLQLGRIYASLKFDAEATAAYEEAAKLFKQRIKTQPDDGRAWFSLGELFDAQGQNADAIIAYKQAARSLPIPLHFKGLGDAYMNQQDYPNAIAAHQQFIKSLGEEMPDWTGLVLERLGDAYLAAAQFSDAIDAYKHGLEIFPKDSKTWYKLGTAHRRAGHDAQATDAFERARELAPRLFKEHGRN